MTERIMLKIGEFARVGQVSIATLRYYDQYGLLKPSTLDPESGYRFYSLDQLPRLNRILALKDLGFPLEQISRLLEEDLSLEQLQGMLRLKQAQIQETIEAEQARLARIAARLRQIEQEGIMPAYDVLLKQVEPLLVASIRESISIGDDTAQRQKSIFAYLDQQGGQYSRQVVTLWYSPHKIHDDGIYADIEIAVPLQAPLAGNEQVSVRTLPGGLMACAVHTGNIYIGRAFAALHQWIENNGYRIVGPPRQVSLQYTEHMDASQAVTEVQFPVEQQRV